MDKSPSKLPLPRTTKKVFQLADRNTSGAVKCDPLKVNVASSSTESGQASNHGSSEAQIRHKPSLLSKSWHSRTAHNNTSSTKSTTCDDRQAMDTQNGNPMFRKQTLIFPRHQMTHFDRRTMPQDPNTPKIQGQKI